MNRKIIQAFSLIEVLIATTILSIAVFWVYKLIGENTKIINNSDNYVQAHTMIPNIIACIENIWFDTFESSPTQSYQFEFWSTGTWCILWANTVTVDNIDYQLYGNITNSGSNYIDRNIRVRSDAIGSVTKNYKQIKR